MIKMLTAYTYERNDPELAVSEVLEQLNLDSTRLKNSVGIIHCFSDFLYSGVIDALCASLPFNVVGCTGLDVSISGEVGPMMLCVSVLTSDDVQFSAATTGSLSGNCEESLRQACRTALRGLPSDSPDLTLVFSPLLRHGGDWILGILDQELRGTPIFGTVASDANEDFLDTFTIYNGICNQDSMSIVMMSGAVKPRFIGMSIRKEKIQKQKAIITKSEKNILHTVNDLPFLTYMETLGVTEGNGLAGISAVPFIADCLDGTEPLVRSIYTITADGHGFFAGSMPEGATLAIGSLDYEDVLATARKIVEKAKKNDDANGMIIYSCISRAYALGADFDAELRIFRDAIGKKLPYTICYSAGEICPQYKSNGRTSNCFHNFTIMACIL